MAETTLALPTRAPRRFFPDDLTIDSWAKLEPYFERLKDRSLDTVEQLEEWLADVSEVEAVLEEDQAWRYIHSTIDTKNEEHRKAYEFFVKEISPKVSPYFNDYNTMLMSSPALDELDEEKFRIYLRGKRKELEIFREENISIFTEVRQMANDYQAMAGALNIEYKGETLTMQQAMVHLKDVDRSVREEVYTLMAQRRDADKEKIDELFSQMVEKRHQIGLNADFESYRDYKFASLGRFDYTKEDCFAFHESIEKEIVPIIKTMQEHRKELLGYDTLRPWDTDVDPSGKAPQKPFSGETELVQKSIEVFNRIDPYFGECLEIMREMGHLDLESKAGKAPGGYNYPLYEIGVPFIFMNAVGSARDLVVMMHEGGHAVHSFLTRDLELTSFKSFPSEVAELASMTMELISMDHWDVFYDSEEELKRARRDQMERVLTVFPWVAIIDAYQHWLYENPSHTADERLAAWKEIQRRFGTGMVDFSGFEYRRDYMWQGQTHVFEMPFYYIEYAIAQLGAIAVWKNYKEDPTKAIEQYKNALSLGYTKSMGEIFEAAGIKFDFSVDYVKELAAFVTKEMQSYQ